MLTYLLVQFLSCVVITEAISELVIKSEIFKPVRQGIFKLGSWFEKLFSCGYCFSVWAAFGVVFLTNTFYPLTGINVLDLGLTAVLVHRSSNILHNVIDKWTDKYYDMRFVNTEKGD
jgi:hypothetical protein